MNDGTVAMELTLSAAFVDDPVDLIDGFETFIKALFYLVMIEYNTSCSADPK